MNELFAIPETKPPAILQARRKVAELSAQILQAEWLRILDDVCRFGPGWMRIRFVSGEAFVDGLARNKWDHNDVYSVRDEMEPEVVFEDAALLEELRVAAKLLAAEERKQLGRNQP